MSHVDEGTLHGYLDGQLTSMETVKLEAHLAECAACRARLEEERELAQRALGILAHAAPREEEIPPLLGVTSVPRRLWPRWMPAAWAASLLLALGGGWILGGSAARQVKGSADRRLGDSAQTVAALQEQVPQAAKTAAEADQRYGFTTTPQPRPATDALADRVAAREEAPRRPDSVATTLAAGASQPRRDTITQRPQAAAPPAQAPAAAAETRAANVARSDTAPVPPPVVTGAVAMAWGPVSLDSARALLGGDPLAVAGLRVTRIRAGVEDRTVLVEQPVDSTVTIRLYQQRATEQEGAAREAAAPTAAASQASGERRARSTAQARYVGGLRIEILGPLPADSLSRLLEKLEPIRP